MPKQHSSMGLTLLYPDSWIASPDDTGLRGEGVIIESPGGSFVSINQLDAQRQPSEVIEEAADAMEQEYEEVESEPMTLEINGEEFEGIIQRFYYLDFVIVSKIFAFRLQNSLYLVQVQGEDRDIDQNNLVFDAILTSMMRSIDRSFTRSESH